MRLYGLTGGIGMGKSAAAELLRQTGLPVIDTDALARDLVEPGQPALDEIVAAFGTGLLDPAGRLRRDELARLVFAGETARARLEGILHPRIRAAWQAETNEWRARGCAAGVVVIPLLYETGAAPAFDAVICVACSAATQHNRLRAREWDTKQIERRIAAQWPVTRKLDQATFVVWSEGTLAVLAEQLRRVLQNAGDGAAR